jgi:Mg2+ and Co2+ transporter CorA
MQHFDQSRTLFQLQSELVDTKVDISVSKSIDQVNRAIDQVVKQIIDLKGEMHREIGGLRTEMQQEIGGLRTEMQQEIGGLRTEMHEINNRLSSVEVVLGMRVQKRNELRSRFFDYAFKAGWLTLGAIFTYVMLHAHIIFQ